MSNIKLPAVRHLSDFIEFTGGSDFMSPPVTVAPGFVRDSQNFEEDVYGGYNSIVGYERYDGHTSPSSSLYSVLPCSVFGTVAVGNTITGSTSSATGKVLAITATSLIIAALSGTFTAETTTAYGVTVTGAATLNGASGKLGSQYASLAADNQRLNISVVPGSGSVLGVWQYKGIVYAFRNNAGATAVGMYKSSSSGWVTVPLGYEVYFSAGSGTAPVEGSTITKGTVSGTLTRLVIESGTFAGGTAAGRLIFSTITNTPFTAGAFTAGISATCVSQNTITIPNINGRFNFINANFYGAANKLRMYGCDGVNRAFEFDGNIFVPINTGLGASDIPSHIIDHQHYLFLSVQSALLVSSIGNPYTWTPLTGAGEIDVSDTITGMMKQPGDSTTPALAVYCRNRTYILYGTGSTSWNLTEYNSQAGAIPWSIQKIGMTYAFDDRGITNLSTTQNFGNFVESTISQRVQNWLKTKRAITTDSHIVRDKQQYRLFFSDGTAAYWTLGANLASMMPVKFPNVVKCSCSDEMYLGGDELIYFGSDSGYVYQMDRGTSFDGASIISYIDLAFNNFKSYRFLKKFRRISFELKGTGYVEFGTSYDLGYASVNISQPGYVSNSVNLTPANWDDSATLWDSFVWDGTPLTALSMSTPGIGENISIKILINGNYFAPIKFSGCFIEYSPQRQMR